MYTLLTYSLTKYTEILFEVLIPLLNVNKNKSVFINRLKMHETTKR